MKRMNLILAIPLVLATSTMVLDTGRSRDKGTDTTALPSPPSIIAPARKEHLPKRLPTRGTASAAPAQAPATVLSTNTIPPPPIVPSRSIIEPTTGMEFLPVPGGCFIMGDNTGDADEMPAHQVCLNDYYIGKFEVTQGQWQLVMGTNPSFFSSCGENCPVENVSWNDTQEFISKLNKLNGRTYRLLTEAEWEYACRGGSKMERYCGSNNIDVAGWYDKNSSSKPHLVGEKQPNDIGIHDMSGNVWEWVNDRFQKDYYSKTQINSPTGPTTGAKRVIRGGSWYNDARNVRASIRGSDEPDRRNINLGFRLAYSSN